jgi:hypothetical protein
MSLYKIKMSLGGTCSVSLLLAIMLLACDKDSNSSDSYGKPVVECYISPGNKIEVKITNEISYGSEGDTLLPIPNLNVFVICNGVSRQLTYIGDAIYSISGVVVDTGITYQLQFEYNGKQISASTTIPHKPTNFAGSDSTIDIPTPGSAPSGFPDPITYTWDNHSKDYHLLLVKCIEPTPVEIDTSRTRTFSFRTEPTQTNTQKIDIRRFTYYGRHMVVLYRVWSEYAALYESNESNSNNLTTPPGNITNGWGIFTGINFSDSLFITANK